jgi:hypothetical protein
MALETVIRRRREARDRLVARARTFAAALGADPRTRAVVVFGSVARGDFNLWSDVDVLVVADGVTARALDRLDALPPWPPGVQPLVWSVDEWRTHLAGGNPIAVEAVRRGLWLVGSPEALPVAARGTGNSR